MTSVPPPITDVMTVAFAWFLLGLIILFPAITYTLIILLLMVAVIWLARQFFDFYSNWDI